MTSKFRLCLLITLALLVGYPGGMVFAQTEPGIQADSVNLNLLPEFNQPSVFVVYEINLNQNVALPQELIFQVPSDAQVFNVINFSPDHRPFELAYQETQIGDWKDLQFSPTYPHIHIEYQDPNLVREGNQRRFELKWLSLYPVTSLSVRVRQPLGASEINSDPPLAESTETSEGIGYYLADFGTIPAGELFSFTLSYTKDTGNPNYPSLAVEAAMPFDETAPGRTASPLRIILWLFTAAVAVVIMVGVYYLWFRASVADRYERVVQGVGIMNPEKQAIFCHECGMRSKVEDSFCSNCGTELRRPAHFPSSRVSTQD